MIPQIHDRGGGATLLDRVEACDTYFDAGDVAATYEGFGETESFDDFCVAEAKTDWRERERTLRERLLSRAQGGESPRTMESELECAISSQTESPFDTLDELRNNDEKVLEIIFHVRNHLKVSFAHKLADRLEFLVEAAKEEDPDQAAILPESLRGFVGFLQSATNLDYPDVVLSPSMNVRVQWRTGPNRHFAVEFLSSGDAHFVIFAPDPKHPEKIIRLSGLVSVDSLMDTVQPHGVLSWSSR